MANQVIVTNTGNVQVALTPTPNVQVQISRAAIGTVSNVPTANFANYAGNVTVAAQPNITSLGILTGLTVSGNGTIGNLTVTGNLSVGNLFANNANYANYANVANTANSVAVANVVGIGNIAITNYDGNGSNILHGNGFWGPEIGPQSVANANYANFAGTAYSVSGANVSGEVSNANYATYSGTAYNVAVANVSGIGNIATINLDGNVSNILHGDGSFGPEAGNLNANYANYAGNVVNASQSNITSLGNLTDLRISNSNIHLGSNAGVTTQSANSIAIGTNAGLTNQGNGITNARSIAIGFNAANLNQGESAVAIGRGAGQNTQANYSVALGWSAAGNTQGSNSIAIGTVAGNTLQGNYAVAIGVAAGRTNQANNSIVINATGSNLDQTTANTFTVKPVRNANTSNIMYYNNSTGEITYDTLIQDDANYANFAGEAFNVNVANVSGIGNIAVINLDGNSANVLHGNGVFAPESETGNANYAAYAGNVTIAAQPNITSTGNLLYANIVDSSNTIGAIRQFAPNSITIVTNAATNTASDLTVQYWPNASTGMPVPQIIRSRGDSSTPATAVNGDRITQTRYLAYNGSSNVLAVTETVALSATMNSNSNAFSTGATWTIATGNPNGDIGNANATSGLNVLQLTANGGALILAGNGTTATNQLQMVSYGVSNATSLTSGSQGVLMQRARGNRDANLSVQASDQLGRMVFQGHNGSAFQNNRVGMLRAVVDATYTANTANIPIGLQLITCDNTTSYTHQFYANGTIQTNGNLDIRGNAIMFNNNTPEFTLYSTNNAATFNVNGLTVTNQLNANILNVTGNVQFANVRVEENLIVGNFNFPSINETVLWSNLQVSGGYVRIDGFEGNTSTFQPSSLQLGYGNVPLTLLDGNINVQNANGNGGTINTINLDATGNITYNRTFGDFYNASTITPSAANTPNVLPLGSAVSSQNCSIQSTSQLLISKSGNYNIQFSLQAVNADNSAEHDFWVWLRKNGSDVTNSATDYTVIKNNGKTVAALTFNIASNGSDYFEIAYAVADTQITFPAYTANSQGFTHPAIPSLIVNLIPIGA